jgi:hypothetical protein
MGNSSAGAFRRNIGRSLEECSRLVFFQCLGVRRQQKGGFPSLSLVTPERAFVNMRMQPASLTERPEKRKVGSGVERHEQRDIV